MSDLFQFIVYGFATWLVAYGIVEADLTAPLRSRLVGWFEDRWSTRIGRFGLALFACVVCVSFWVAAVMSWVPWFVARWFGIAGLVTAGLKMVGWVKGRFGG